MLLPASDQTATQAANAAAAAGIRAVMMLSGLERRSVMGIVTPGRRSATPARSAALLRSPASTLSTGAPSFHTVAGSQARRARAGCGAGGLTAREGRKDNPSVDLQRRARDDARGRARQRASRRQEEKGKRPVSAQRGERRRLVRGPGLRSIAP